MAIQDIYVKIYNRIVGNSKMLKPIRLIVRSLANVHLRYAFKLNRSNNRCSGNYCDVIVSITSFPARINNLWIVIETLLRQSVKPQKILVWLSKEQFDENSIPHNLRELDHRGVEIRFVEGDIKSHKKYYYVFQEHPNDLIMFADDDIIYPSDLIESLLKARNQSDAEKVVTHKYGYRMKWDEDGNLKPYHSWGSYYEAYSGDDLFFGSGGGTLVRPSDFHKDVLNLELALHLCPKADDIWLNAMAKMGGCKYIKVLDGPFIIVQNKHDTPLYRNNIFLNQNDKQLKDIVEFYVKSIDTNPFMRKI